MKKNNKRTIKARKVMAMELKNLIRENSDPSNHQVFDPNPNTANGSVFGGQAKGEMVVIQAD